MEQIQFRCANGAGVEITLLRLDLLQHVHTIHRTKLLLFMDCRRHGPAHACTKKKGARRSSHNSAEEPLR